MPNHVVNRISLKGDPKVIRAMLESVKSDEYGIGSVDFNKIIPRPESLNIEAGSRTDQGLKAYRDFIDIYNLGRSAENALKALENIPKESEEAFLRIRTDIRRNEWELGKAAWNNIRKYGAPTWYEWSISNWGTKWNAYGYGEDTVGYQDGDELYFQTAWSAPHPILEKLSEMFPEIEAEHEWADEDIGQNCGRYCYKGGERTEEYIPEGQKESVEFACKVWDYDPMDLDLCLNAEGTKYICVENEEYQQIELFDKLALFSNERLTDADIPQSMYCYHLRHNDDGDRFCSIEPKVGVNHGGSIITKEPIDFGEQGYISFTEDTEPNFTGEDMTFLEFMNEQSPQESEVMKLC